MGEIAEDMVDGSACQWCGAYFDESHGYPVVCHDCWNEASKEERKNVQKSTYSLL